MNAPDFTDRNRWYALLVCLAGGFIVFLDVSIVNVAPPTISSCSSSSRSCCNSAWDAKPGAPALS